MGQEVSEKRKKSPEAKSWKDHWMWTNPWIIILIYALGLLIIARFPPFAHEATNSEGFQTKSAPVWPKH